MGLPGSLDALDSSKVIALDFRSAEFRRNAHRLVAGWARQPPFYVLGDGPPQVIVGRYADVHEVFSDAERFASQLPKGPGYEQYDKFMGFPFLTQMDGEQHAQAAPAADAGILLAPHGAARVEHRRHHRERCSTTSSGRGPHSMR